MKIGLVIVAFLYATLANCSPPPIVDDIRCDDWHDCSAANRKFTAAIRRRFPIGSNQVALKAELIRQGFEHVNPPIARCSLPGEIGEIGKPMIECPPWDAHWNPQNDLVADLDVLSVCGQNVWVIWSADAGGKITHIEGFYDVTCL